MILSLQDIFVFVKCTINSRNLVEGECVLNSNQIILCGKIITENVSFEIIIIKTALYCFIAVVIHRVNV